MNRSISGFIIYIATTLYLLVAGVTGLLYKTGEFYSMTRGIIGAGGFSSSLALIFSLAAVVAGGLLLLQLFGLKFGIIEILLIAFSVLWALFILVIDIILPLRNHPSFWDWLRVLASHLVVLGAIASGTRLFGGD
jgi:Zn-dependent protease with chaperone function